jgi:DNA-binding protein HU-beta
MLFCRVEPEVGPTFYLTKRLDTRLTACPSCSRDLDRPAGVETEGPSGRTQAGSAVQRAKAGKQDIAEAMLEHGGDLQTKAEAERALDAVRDSLVELLSKGTDVFVSGLGTFKIRQSKARRVRNPQTGERMEVPPKQVVRFVPAKGLKGKLNP